MSDTPRTNFVAHETGDTEWDRFPNRFGRMMAHACILEKELAAAIAQRDRLARAEERLAEYDRDWPHIIREVLACGPISACKRADDQIEPPWEVIKRTRERAEQAERRAEEMQEKCAKICEEISGNELSGDRFGALDCAAAIRALKECGK